MFETQIKQDLAPAPRFVDNDRTAGTMPVYEGDLKDAFATLLDTINPLHHVPIVGQAYRAVTGDALSAPTRLLGSALFGGPVAFAGAVADTVIEAETGQDLGAHALAMAGLDDAAPDVPGDVPEIALAQAYNAQDDYDMARTLLSFAPQPTEAIQLVGAKSPRFTVEHRYDFDGR